MARVQSSVPIDAGTEQPRSIRLLATAFYDVWLVTWPADAGLEPHDHGDVRSVLHVVDGEVTEFYRDRAVRADPVARTLRRGVSVTSEPSIVHALANRSGRDATTLHVYSPPLVDVTSSDLSAGDPYPTRHHPASGVEPRRAVTPVDSVARIGSQVVLNSGPPPWSWWIREPAGSQVLSDPSTVEVQSRDALSMMLPRCGPPPLSARSVGHHFPVPGRRAADRLRPARAGRSGG